MSSVALTRPNSSIRVSHSAAGVPEFIQLFGQPADAESSEAEAPLYLGHIHEVLSAETMRIIISSEDLGLKSH